MKKLFLLLFASVLVFSCTNDAELADTTADFSATLAQYDDTNIGAYKGLFTTEGMERGVLEITITPGNYATASVDIVNGTTVFFKSNQIINVGDDIQNLRFESTASFNATAFDFSVDKEGNNVEITNVVYNGAIAGMIAAHDTSRAPVVPITGVLSCDDCDAHPLLVSGATGTFSLLYVGDGSGADSMSAIASVGVVVSTGGTQAACTDNGADTTCPISGGGTIGNNVIAWSGTHLYLNGSDCSEAAGIWSLSSNHGAFTGTFTSDVACAPAGPNCNQELLSNAFEDGKWFDSGNGWTTANDIIVAADENMDLTQIVVNAFVVPGQSVASADVSIWSDVAGLPGVLISTENLVPTSEVWVGSNFGFDVNAVTFDLSQPTLLGQAGISTAYWVAVQVTCSAGGTSYWEFQSVATIGSGHAYSSDGGASWVDQIDDGVYSFSGTCSPLSPAQENTDRSTSKKVQNQNMESPAARAESIKATLKQ